MVRVLISNMTIEDTFLKLKHGASYNLEYGHWRHLFKLKYGASFNLEYGHWRHLFSYLNMVRVIISNMAIEDALFKLKYGASFNLEYGHWRHFFKP